LTDRQPGPVSQTPGHLRPLRASIGGPIGVAVIGTGYFGSGLLRRLAALRPFEPRVAANRSLARALSSYARAGISRDAIVITDDPAVAQEAIRNGRHVATSSLLLACELDGIDVVAEATGDLLAGTSVAVAAIETGKHVVAANSDVHATLGPLLKTLADRAGVVYTDIDGDEPGLLKQLIEYCQDLGLEVLVAGSGKGVLKRYATPETQAEFAASNGLQPWMATAAADGTKLNFEMTVVANATGYLPAIRGMHGPMADLAKVAQVFSQLGLLDGAGPYVEYLLGGRGVFVVVHSEDPEVRRDFKYLKLGDGPHYVLQRPEVLAHYAAPLSIRRAAWLHEPTVSPRGAPVAETVAFAKRRLEPGDQIDGVGGFDAYGLIVRADEARRDQLLPMGLCQFVRMARPVAPDQPLTYRDVEFQVDNLALELRRQQDAQFGIDGSRAIGPLA
jgi:predicted homoserine dehydrogenase-like protein